MKRTLVGCLAALAGAQAALAQEPARPDGWVILSLDQYHSLRSRAYPAPPAPPSPPVEATLTRVDYDLRAAGDTVTGEARLTIDVLKQGWASVQVPQGLLVRAARLDGRPIAIVDDKPARVLISASGRSMLTLDIVAPVVSAGTTESLTLPAAGSAVSAVTLTVPRSGVDLAAAGGIVVERSETSSESRWVFYGAPGQNMNFSWARRADDRRATLPLRVRARITQLVSLGEESTLVTASVRVEIMQGAAREIVLGTPDGMTVNHVTGSSVGDWTHAKGTLTVSLLEPVVGTTSFVVAAETRTPRDGSIDVPLIRMPGAERESGGVAVDVAGAGEIQERLPRGLDPADASELGDVVSGRESPSMAAFRFRPLAGGAPRALTVTVSRYTPQAVLVANIEEARYEALAGDDGKTLVRARYAVRNNQRSFLALALPARSVLWSAELAGRPVRPGLSPEGHLLLPLQKARSGESAPAFVVELVYLQQHGAWADRGLASIDLPSVDLPVSRAGLTVRHSPRYRVEPRPGTFRVETDTGPWSTVLGIDVSTASAPPLPPAPTSQPDAAAAAARSLFDRLAQESGRTMAGVVPVNVTLPEFGPTFFVAAELTPESHAPALEIDYRRIGG
ncbi:MAG TPA: hypothetical protein VLD67_00635 [Vicinamibacterales bacterium]|nr:hypothetical protein [Vicinamibacterales bacterium]